MKFRTAKKKSTSMHPEHPRPNERVSGLFTLEQPLVSIDIQNKVYIVFRYTYCIIWQYTVHKQAAYICCTQLECGCPHWLLTLQFTHLCKTRPLRSRWFICILWVELCNKALLTNCIKTFSLLIQLSIFLQCSVQAFMPAKSM